MVSLDIKMGVDAKSYAQVAKIEKLKPMELALRKLEDLSDAIVEEFARMKTREEQMRDTNGVCAVYALWAGVFSVPLMPLGPRAESTNERVLQFSVFSMICLVVLAVWQVLYLKRYFKSKKLLD